jgi:hypothetical protein
MKAADGPIPPNYAIAQQEAECAAALENPPWFRTVLPAEHHESGCLSKTTTSKLSQKW